MEGPIEYCGFKYGYDERKGYYIIPNKKVNVPNTFYKYYALNNNSVDALTNMYIYATHPYQFNDPFDCNEKLIEFDSWADVHALWEGLYENFRHNFPSLESACAISRKAYWNLLYKKLGLVSLASRNDNCQMWALYAQNNGFCVEFDVKKFPFPYHGPFPINYTDNISFPVHIGEVGGRNAMLIQTNVKNKWWEYEDEWRLYIPNPDGVDLKYYGPKLNMEMYNFSDEHDRKFRYSTDALTSVTLGPLFFDEINHVIISDTEIEIDIACDLNKNQLEFKVLDFLARITEKLPIDIKLTRLADFSYFRFIPISIIKYSDNKFRLIKKQKILTQKSNIVL